jgi:hypothetical protein
LSRVRVYNDDLFCYDQSPPKNTPNWACKPNNGDKTNPPQPARTEGTTPAHTEGTTPAHTEGTTPAHIEGTTPARTEETTPARTEGTTLSRSDGKAPARTEGMTQPRPIDRNAPTRPGGDYDVSLNYRVEDEHQYGESSAAGMIRGAIAEADARDQQIANDSLNLIFQHYTDEEYDDVEYFEDDF